MMAVMRSHRLDRLALLTQGIALIGFGLADVACGKDGAPASDPPHLNAPPAPASATPSAPAAPVEPPHVNAPPAPAPSASSSATPSASSATPSASSSAAPSPKASASSNIVMTPAPKPPQPPPHLDAPKK
jgi:hypothetical protein